MGGLDWAFALGTVATEGWPRRRVGRTSGAAVYGQKAVVYFATSLPIASRDANFEQQVGVMISVTPSRRRLT